MNFFKRARTPGELVLKCCNAYEELVKAGATGVARQGVRWGTPAQRVVPTHRADSWRCAQALDHIVKYMGEMKTMLYGDAATDKAPKEEDGKLLTQEAAKSKLLTHMCLQLLPLGFEVRLARLDAWHARALTGKTLASPCAHQRRVRTWRRCSAACYAAPATMRSLALTTCSSTRRSSAA